MRIKNYTDIPSETIREIIRFVRPPGISGFDVRISNSKHLFAGRAYYQGCGLHDTANPFIIVRITRNEKMFPYSVPKKKGGYLPCELLSRIEAIVLVVSHELRHLWQDKYPHSKRLGGGRGKFSELDADTYAIEKLKLWREKEMKGD